MESPVPSKRKTRSKSANSKNSEEQPESAPNQNGNKDGVNDEESPPIDKPTEMKIDESPPSPPKSRKRKASEMKSESSGGEELQQLEKEMKEVIEPEAKDPQDLVIDDASMSDDKIDESEDKKDDMSSLPPKQMFGKGKRARIPNKRYSDIVLTSPKSERSRRIENGENQMDIIEKENSLNDTFDATNSPSLSLARTRLGANSPHSSKKQKVTIDLTNPNYLKPFQFGWKRELVHRATSDSSLKRNSDIYYYTPSGKKVRSMREVSENLKNKELTLDDFTFYKEPLGIDDPEKEIIREAKLKTAGGLRQSLPKPAKVPKISSPKLSQTTTGDTPTQKAKSSPKITSGLKVKLPKSQTAKSKLEKKAKEDTAELEIGTYPPNWSSPGTKKSSSKWGTKSSKSPPVKTTPKTSIKPKRLPSSEERGMDAKFMENYMQNLAYGYGTLLYVFQYLKVQDLLRAGCVCTMWRDVAKHPVLWKTVRMKNSQIHSFDGLADTLQKHGTDHLDLRKMLLPNGSDELWPSFSRAIKNVDSLRKIELCRCPAAVLEQLAASNPKLEVINALAIKCETMSLDPLANVSNLQELRLKATNGLTLSSDLTALKELKHMKVLSLTSIKDLHKLNLEVIADLKNLESLELGECMDLPNTFGSDILSKLEKLEKLRLEKGQGTCYTFEILEAVKGMPRLEQLELVNFDIKSGFDKALGCCTNIKKLLIIPTYISQSATTNHMVLGGVLRLQNTLSHFVWGVTLELLRVTELFVDQCEDSDKKEKRDKKPVGNGDSIPVLKPVPLLGEKSEPPVQSSDPPQVEILPLPNLQKLLLGNLPSTRVKILKIPFHATWRQTISDSVN